MNLENYSSKIMNDWGKRFIIKEFIFDNKYPLNEWIILVVISVDSPQILLVSNSKDTNWSLSFNSMKK